MKSPNDQIVMKENSFSYGWGGSYRFKNGEPY